MSSFLSWPRLLGGVFLLAAGLLSVLAFQEAPSVYDNTLFTQVAVLETRVAALETRVGQIVPTQEVLVTPTLTPTPLPTCPQARVTASPRLLVRDGPGGGILDRLNTGDYVVFDPDSATPALGFVYVRIYDPDGRNTWIAREFIEPTGGLLKCP